MHGSTNVKKVIAIFFPKNYSKHIHVLRGKYAQFDSKAVGIRNSQCALTNNKIAKRIAILI